jgi:hypothetical protein
MSLPAHSPLGPSSAERWIACPGSVLATKGLPDTDSDYSLEGTAAHELAEKCRELDEPAKKFLGHVIDVRRVDGRNHEVLVNQEMVDAVQHYVDHVNGLPGYDFNETRVYYTDWVKDGFGTMDAARGNDGTVYIRDLKYGKGIQVYARENEQLMLYALGFYAEYGHLFDIEQFDLGIVQPRLDHVDTWTISRKELLLWAGSVAMPAAELALTPGAPFKAGSHCQFCKIKGTCKARAMSAFETAVGEFEDLDDAIDKAGDLSPVVGVLTNEQIARILPSVKGMKKWIADIERHAFSETAQGRFDGYKIVGGRGNRVLRDEAKIEFELAGIPDEKLYEPREFKSVAQLEAALGKAMFKPATEKKPAGPFAHLVEKRPGKPTLAAIDDPREAITLSATDAFDDVDDE